MDWNLVRTCHQGVWSPLGLTVGKFRWKKQEIYEFLAVNWFDNLDRKASREDSLSRHSAVHLFIFVSIRSNVLDTFQHVLEIKLDLR